MQVGRYTVIRSLGQGGMAKVLLARSQQGDEVVLKVPLSSDPELFERLRDEARVGLRLSHPSVVETLDLFEHDGKPILVVNFIRGASLSQMRKVGPLPPAVVARIGRQIADGLATLHEATDEAGKNLGILHRDVTAGNILVDHSGDARLIDLGIARSTESQARRTRLGAVRGTLRYLAPELIQGKPHSPATDLWSLGVVLWEGCLGRRAISGDQKEVLQAIRDHKVMRYQGDERVDPRLHDAIGALLAPEVQRLQKARAAANIFRRLETAFGESTTAAIAAVRRAEGVNADDEEEPGIGRNTAELLGASKLPAESFAAEDDDTRLAPRKVTLPPGQDAIETDDNAHPTIQMPAAPTPPSVLESLPTRQMPQVQPDVDDDANVFNEPTVRRAESFVKTTAGRPSLVDESVDDNPEDDPATIQMAPQEFPPEVQEAMKAAVSPAIATPGAARPPDAQKTKALYGSSLAELSAKASRGQGASNKEEVQAAVSTSSAQAPVAPPKEGQPKAAPVPSLRNPDVEKLQQQARPNKEPPKAPAAPAPAAKAPAPPAQAPVVVNPPAAPAPAAKAPAAKAPAAKAPAVNAPAAAAPAPPPKAPATPAQASVVNAPAATQPAATQPAPSASAPATAAPPPDAQTSSPPSASLAAPPVATPATAQPAPEPAPASESKADEAASFASPVPGDMGPNVDTEQIERRSGAAAETGAFDADDIDWKPKRTGLYAFVALLVFVLFGVFVMAIYSVFFDNPSEEAPPATEEVAVASDGGVGGSDEAAKVVEEPPPPPKKKTRKRKRRKRRKAR